MQIKKDFTIQKVGNSYIAVAGGEPSKPFHGMVRLNETGAFLWKKMSEGDVTVDELVDALLSEYEVDRETAAHDVEQLVAQFRESGILA